jgi:hypothetical protein
MPKYRNEDVELALQESWKMYSGSYLDRAGNTWRVDAAGIDEVVSNFAEEKDFFLVAEPVSETDTHPPQPEDWDSVEQKEEPDDIPPDPPSMEVTYTLVELVEGLAPPYRVTFEIDPRLHGSSQGHSFRLKGSDTKANVSYTASGGSVKVSLYSNSRSSTGSGTGGSVSISSVPEEARCYVSVRKLSGTPYYTLSGDITVT